MNLEIYELKKMDLRNGIVIDGFPSVGLVSSIVANYIIDALNLEQIAIVDSTYFPAVALIREGVPLSPVRIYGGEVNENLKIAVFISEFQIPSAILKPLATLMLDWADDQKISTVISPEGLIQEEKKENVEVYAVTSTKYAREKLPPYVLEFNEGVITGVTGVLLTEGKKRGTDVIALLAEAHPNYPDARAAAKIVEVLNDIIQVVKIDPKPLYEEAEKIEKNLSQIREQAAKVKKVPKDYIYA